MSMRFSCDCDACDGDGQCKFCSIEFHLRAKCINDQTLDVTSNDLYSSDHIVDFSDSSGYENSEQRGNAVMMRSIAKKQIRQEMDVSMPLDVNVHVASHVYD